MQRVKISARLYLLLLLRESKIFYVGKIDSVLSATVCVSQGDFCVCDAGWVATIMGYNQFLFIFVIVAIGAIKCENAEKIDTSAG